MIDSAATAATAARPTQRLTPADVDAFTRKGYYFPLRALSLDDAISYRRRLEQSEALVGGPLRGSLRNKPHLLFPWANELIRHPAVLDAVQDLFGPNLLVWSSSFFIKEAHDPSYVSWHQDSTYWGLSHPDVVTAWIALTDSVVENGCMRVIPGSHLKDQLPHQDTFAENNLLTRGQEVMVEVDAGTAVDIELQPGEFSLHHVRLVHGSDPNPADRRRIGYAIRYIPTYVRQTEGPRDCATLVRGVDSYHHFDPEPVPKVDMDPEVVELHRRITEEAAQILYRGTDRRNPK
jgi:non-heme Fe2+,alpha-ketoglutarate-dependent halogenase